MELILPAKETLNSINNQIKLALYRIIQEQVSNVLKHADAKHVSVTIDVSDTNVTLIVEDDGVGFNPQKQARGIGLKNIESRCNLFSGTMNLITSPGEGCMMRVQIPTKSTVYV